VISPEVLEVAAAVASRDATALVEGRTELMLRAPYRDLGEAALLQGTYGANCPRDLVGVLVLGFGDPRKVPPLAVPLGGREARKWLGVAQLIQQVAAPPAD
jgi:hypothetical protein